MPSRPIATDDDDEIAERLDPLTARGAGHVIARAWRAYRKRALFGWLKGAIRDVVRRRFQFSI